MKKACLFVSIGNFLPSANLTFAKVKVDLVKVEGLPGGGGGSLFPCSLPKLPNVPMFPHSLKMFSYCNFSKFCSLFPKIA